MSPTLTSQDDNVWSTLPYPLSDIFLQEIAPKYLSVKDFLNLAVVSKKYNNLLGPKTKQGNRILGLVLQNEAKKYHARTGELLYIEQLPTIGNLSVEESLQEDAVLVGQLRMAAMRRRALVLLSQSSTCDKQQLSDEDRINQEIGQHQATIFQYRSRTLEHLKRIGIKYGVRISAATLFTEFVCLNLSDVDIYCRLINSNGRVLVHDESMLAFKLKAGGGDRRHSVSSFVSHDDDEPPAPPNVGLIPMCPLYSSFALCLEERGPPFAIYQARRGWYRIGVGLDNGVMQIHAIAVVPGCVVKELHCDSTWNLDPETARTYRSYDFVDRSTGQVVPHDATSTTSTVRSANQQLSARTEIVQQQGGLSEGAEKDQLAGAKDLARNLYGLNIPPFLKQLRRQPGDGLPRLLNTPIGEAVSYEDNLLME